MQEDEMNDSIILEKISKYYKLKTDYETSLKTTKVKRCIICNGLGGNSFSQKIENNSRFLIAKCTANNECNFLIKINVGYYVNNHDAITDIKNEINDTKRKIILFKNNILFGVLDNKIELAVVKNIKNNKNFQSLTEKEKENNIANFKKKYTNEQTEIDNVYVFKNLMQYLEDNISIHDAYYNNFKIGGEEESMNIIIRKYESQIIQILNNELNNNDALLNNYVLKIIYDAYNSNIFSNKNVDFTSYYMCTYFINKIEQYLSIEQDENEMNKTINNILKSILFQFNKILTVKYSNSMFAQTPNGEIKLIKTNIYQKSLNEGPSGVEVINFDYTLPQISVEDLELQSTETEPETSNKNKNNKTIRQKSVNPKKKTKTIRKKNK